jgi:hypothetical protein
VEVLLDIVQCMILKIRLVVPIKDTAFEHVGVHVRGIHSLIYFYGSTSSTCINEGAKNIQYNLTSFIHVPLLHVPLFSRVYKRFHMTKHKQVQVLHYLIVFALMRSPCCVYVHSVSRFC